MTEQQHLRMKDYVVCAIEGCDSLITNGHSRYCKNHQMEIHKHRHCKSAMKISVRLNTREVAKLAGVTYGKLNYLVTRGALEPTGNYRQGKAREFSEHDVVAAKVAVILRDCWVPIDKINRATKRIVKTIKPIQKSSNEIVVSDPAEINIRWQPVGIDATFETLTQVENALMEANNG